MKIVRSLLACVLLLLSAITTFALNPDLDLHQFAHRSWGEKDGYPGAPNSLAQTADGFLWLGSITAGLFRFDGIRFERYTPLYGDKLPNGNVTSLLALPDGSLWIGYDGLGISVLRNGRITNYASSAGVPESAFIGALAVDHDGTLWANTGLGLLRFNGSRWEQIGSRWNFPEKVQHISTLALFVDSHGTLWAGMSHTVLYLKQGSKRFEPTGAVSEFSASIAEAPDGTIWLADGETYIRTISTSVPAKAAATAKCEMETPVGSPAHCPAGDPSEIQVITPYNLLFDRAGSLWITTNARESSRN